MSYTRLYTAGKCEPRLDRKNRTLNQDGPVPELEQVLELSMHTTAEGTVYTGKHSKWSFSLYIYILSERKIDNAD